jgi:hypothetical protein
MDDSMNLPLTNSVSNIFIRTINIFKNSKHCPASILVAVNGFQRETNEKL